MKIYVVHATVCDYKNKLYRPLKVNRLAEAYQFIFPHASNEGCSKLAIQTSDLVFAKVSYASTRTGIELA